MANKLNKSKCMGRQNEIQNPWMPLRRLNLQLFPTWDGLAIFIAQKAAMPAIDISDGRVVKSKSMDKGP